jgi:Cytochrome c7 and related cytochrome c
MKRGSRCWGSMGRWLSLAAVVAVGTAGSQAPLPPALQVADALAQTTPAPKPGVEPGAAPGEAKPESPKGDKPKPQTAKEADEALAKLMAQRKPIRAATARGQTAAEAPEFKVAPRLDRIRNYPCTKCHDNKFVDRRVRELQDEHTKLVFEHGGGRFWCYDACHKGTDMDNLVSLRGRPVRYDESYKLCGQCHFQRLDWYFGGHGKRQGAWEDQREIPKVADELRVEDRSQIGRWKGERTILNCTECHDAHSPAIKPFEPSPSPKIRSGLRQPSMKLEPEPKIWERLAEPRGKR